MIEQFARVYEAEKLRIQRRRTVKVFIISAVVIAIFIAYCAYDIQQINQIPAMPIPSNYSVPPAAPQQQQQEKTPWERV